MRKVKNITNLKCKEVNKYFKGGKKVKRFTKLSILMGLTMILLVATCGLAMAAVSQDLGMYDKAYSAYTVDECRGCHTLNTADLHHSTNTYNDPTKGCYYCHTKDAVTGALVVERNCFATGVCHSTSGHHTSQAALAGSCTNCHDPNMVNEMGTGLVAPNAPTYPVSAVSPEPRACATCHDEFKVWFPTEEPNKASHHAAAGTNCEWCHQGDPNVYDVANIRMCESCHTMGSLHNIAAHTADNATCIKCHAGDPGGTPPEYTAAPSITTVTPQVAKKYTYVIIQGTNFGTNYKKSGVGVYFTYKNSLGVEQPPVKAAVSYWFPDEIKVMVPAIPNGNGTIYVKNSIGESDRLTFTVVSDPTLISVSPTSAAPGAKVTLTGTGINMGATTVKFINGGTVYTLTPDAGSVTATQAVVTLPTNMLGGSYSVTVTNDVGTSNALSFAVASSTVTPKITSINPNYGSVGRTVVIYGSNLTLNLKTAPTVKFGTINATVTSFTATKIYCKVPTGLSAGYVNVTVNNGVGTSNAVSFRVI